MEWRGKAWSKVQVQDWAGGGDHGWAVAVAGGSWGGMFQDPRPARPSQRGEGGYTRKPTQIVRFWKHDNKRIKKKQRWDIKMRILVA